MNGPASVPFDFHSKSRIRLARSLLLTISVLLGGAVYLLGAVPRAATPARKMAQQAPAADSSGSPVKYTPKADANLLQIMRGVMFPESNVVFAGQMDVSQIPAAKQPAISTDLITSSFGGWQAVENSALALAESANLLFVPGRSCANGHPVPVDKADWTKFAQGMHDTAMTAYKAAQAKDTDAMLDAADAVSVACMACHNVYRSNRTQFEGRCIAYTPPAPTAK